MSPLITLNLIHEKLMIHSTHWNTWKNLIIYNNDDHNNKISTIRNQHQQFFCFTV